MSHVCRVIQTDGHHFPALRLARCSVVCRVLIDVLLKKNDPNKTAAFTAEEETFRKRSATFGKFTANAASAAIYSK